MRETHRTQEALISLRSYYDRVPAQPRCYIDRRPNDHEGRLLRPDRRRKDTVNSEALLGKMIQILLQFRQIGGSVHEPSEPACILRGELPGCETHTADNANDHGKVNSTSMDPSSIRLGIFRPKIRILERHSPLVASGLLARKIAWRSPGRGCTLASPICPRSPVSDQGIWLADPFPLL